jgi:putative NADPH-quinone reductase
MEKKRVLAISGSQRKPSFTEKLLDLCIEGMGDGVEVVKFHPHQMKIAPCNSCWTCWTKTPGVCARQDDFQQILEAYRKADYFLWAFPLYIHSMPAPVKNVLDRFFILLEPGQTAGANGKTEHPKRFGRSPRTVLISSCGFPEAGNFDLLRAHFRTICQGFGWTHAGEILVSAAGAARVPKLFDRKYGQIRGAGAELLAGSIREETTRSIAEPVISAEEYRKMANAAFAGGLGFARAAAIGIKAAWKERCRDQRETSDAEK